MSSVPADPPAGLAAESALASDPLALYERALLAGEEGITVNVEDGTVFPLPLRRWLEAAEPADLDLLERVEGPVLDIGCGPGRHLRELAVREIPALGIDISPLAARMARARGASVWRGSVFGPVPGAGTWATALLLDGNVGIGGGPEGLLGRLGELLTEGGVVLVELDSPDVASSVAQVCLEHRGQTSPPFPWAVVSASDADELAAQSGFEVTETWSAADRWFAALRRR